MSRNKIKLIFTQLYSLSTGVFFEVDTYHRLLKTENALENAKTWGEFRSLLPDGEFEDLYNWVINGGEQIYWDRKQYLFCKSIDIQEFNDNYDDFIIRSTDAFTSNSVRGVDDAIYPPTMDSMWDDFPDEFLEAYGTRMQGFMDDPWWEFPIEKLTEMSEYLSQHGFSVEKLDEFI